MHSSYFHRPEDFDHYLAAQDRRIILIADSKTNGFCLPLLRQKFPRFYHSPVIVVPEGEKNKSLENVVWLWDELFRLAVSKNDLICIAGGGVLSDLAAFACTAFKRGIDFCLIPTTLLAQVDASIGGKTGINFHGIKNAIGFIQEAGAVYIDTGLLQTLPQRHIRNGLVEMIKHRILSGETPEDTGFITPYLEYQFPLTDILRSIEIKRTFIEEDLNDHTQRQCLNFGHTIGHALESYLLESGEDILHGEAVLEGMMVEARLSEKILEASTRHLAFLRDVKERLYPGRTYSYTLSHIIPYLIQDKKNTDQINMSLLDASGKCVYGVSVSTDLLDEMLKIHFREN